MLAFERYGWTVDEGAPIAYEVLDKGVPVYAADGTEIGTVDHVVAAPEEDIFHGLVISTRAGRRFVAGDQVRSLHERGADLSIQADEVAQLPEPHGGAPSLELKDPTTKTHRWKEILDMVRGRGYLNADWSDEK
jgi:sporulation protein YlmC with PRC-barrel domain